jgi:hypothetical protein
MAQSRVPSLGEAVAVVGAVCASLALVTQAQAQPARELPIVLAGDPTPLIPPSMTNAAPPAAEAPQATAAPVAAPVQPARATPVMARHTPPHGVAGRPLIPPAVIAIPLGATPSPRPPLSIETDLIPLGTPPAAAAPSAKPPSG